MFLTSSMFRRFLISLLFSLCILTTSPMQSATALTTSILPTQDSTADAPTDCIALSERLSINPNAGKWLATKIKCGRMGLEDVIYYLQYMLGFVFNILGTLGLLGIIYAGYQYILNQGKDNKKGQTAIKNAIIGIIIAFSSFTIARVVFSFLQTT